MDIALAVVAIIIGAVVPFWLHRREHPAKEIRYGVQSSRLWPAAIQGSDVAFLQIDGRAVQDPHKVSMRLWSAGRADVPSSAFDSGQPLVIDLGSSMIPGTFSTTSSASGLAFVPASSHEVAIGPGLLSKNFDLSFEALLELEPRISVRSPLVDVSVVPEQLPVAKETKGAQVASVRKRSRVTALRVTLGIVVAAAVVLIVSIVLFQIDREASAAVGGVSLLVLMMCAVTLVVIGIARFVKFVGEVARNSSARQH